MIINLNSATGTQALWSQERIILRGYGQGYAPLYIWTNLHGSKAAPLAQYEQVGMYTYADITDYVRAYPNVSKIYYTDDLSPEATPNELSVQVVGLVNPANDIIPFNCESVSTPNPMEQGDPDPYGLLVSPPHKMLKPIDTANNVLAEVRLASGYSEQYYIASVGVQYDARENSIEIPQSVDAFTIFDDTEQAAAMDFQMTPIDSERNYLMLFWTSRYGGYKQHTWEFLNVKYATEGATEIQQMQNEYDVRKGYELSLTARIEGLTAYDYWYYADVINSSNVRAYYNGQWRKVEIETKDVTIPNTSAGELKTLEITIKFAKYDAV